MPKYRDPESTLLSRLTLWNARYRLWHPGETLVAGVSGGCDSVALLLLLHQLAPRQGFRLAVAHFNHGWRADAGQDAEFVRDLATRLGLTFYLDHASADGAPANREQTGRQLRYAFFARIVAAGHATRAATAHTANDQAETVLLRLLRGAGPGGLAGILPARRLQPQSAPRTLIRPLLGLTRAELEAWLRQRAQPWIEDPGNRDLGPVRNRIRHVLLPELAREYNPSVSRHLAALAELARGDEVYWRFRVSTAAPQLWQLAGADRWQADIAAFWRFPLTLRRRLLRAGLGIAQSDPRRLDAALIERLTDWIGRPPPAPRPGAAGRLRRLCVAGVEITVAARHIVLRRLAQGGPGAAV